MWPFTRKREKETRKMRLLQPREHGPTEIPPTVNVKDFEAQLDKKVNAVKTAADKTVKRLTRSSGISESDIISEAERVLSGIPAKPGDLLGDLVHRAKIDKLMRRRNGRNPA